MTNPTTSNGWWNRLRAAVHKQTVDEFVDQPNFRSRITNQWFFGISPFDGPLDHLYTWQILWGKGVWYVFYAPFWLMYPAWRKFRKLIGIPIKDRH